MQVSDIGFVGFVGFVEFIGFVEFFKFVVFIVFFAFVVKCFWEVQRNEHSERNQPNKLKIASI